MKWLVMLVLLDAAAILLFVAPELLGATDLGKLRAGIGPLLPVVILLLTGLLSHEAKARLVYWKLTDPLPGSEAFTKHALTDSRIDLVALKKNVGPFPIEPADQNARWYQLYGQVKNDPSVSEAHKLYLLYRDMAATSILLLPIAPTSIWYAGATKASSLVAAALFTVQYVVCAIAARHSGARFVSNVLALHSTRKISTARK